MLAVRRQSDELGLPVAAVRQRRCAYLHLPGEERSIRLCLEELNKRRYPMTLNSALQVFLTGFFGGILIELVHWYAIRRDGRWPDYASTAQYWITSLAMALVGGVFAVLYFGSKAEGIVALHVGLSAPLILQKLTTTIANPGGKGVRRDIIDFFRW
ncbi:hypothetical protein Q3C01_08585 [Bradyrhizobium sp. UFLA05-109]